MTHQSLAKKSNLKHLQKLPIVYNTVTTTQDCSSSAPGMSYVTYSYGSPCQQPATVTVAPPPLPPAAPQTADSGAGVDSGLRAELDRVLSKMDDEQGEINDLTVEVKLGQAKYDALEKKYASLEPSAAVGPPGPE
eukprot:CAMPEP_0196758824 /NCGR_PEP_ID=MMETSP1091-20130531/104387_1 /TAXON_ID=302021 /ORGANISM="Rhodomonas sp., Strain CCMP768" /LENGTH=134 /DNA_ID=CAMNT_0042107659 /DNA_START=402 /DNA_END=803 /DNA_ORIENTATION=+